MRVWSKAGRRSKKCCEGSGSGLGSSVLVRFFSVAVEEESSSKIGVYELLDRIRECSVARDLPRGRSIHAIAIETGEGSNLYVANCLISMYSKCGSMIDAKNTFDAMPHRDTVSWNSLLAGYADRGEPELVLELFRTMTTTMTSSGICPNARTFVAALKACSTLAIREEGKKLDGQFVKERSLEKGREIHRQALESGCSSDIFLASTVVDMYASCGSLDEACASFDRMPRHNVVAWSALMMGCAENGRPELALELFLRMKQTNREPNTRAFVAALKACSKVAAKEDGVVRDDGKVMKPRSLRKGCAIHRQAAELGLDSNLFVSSSLLLMYVKCGSNEDAREIFDKMPRHDLVSWTTMLLGYAENGEEEQALEFFARVPVDGSEPDAVACVAAIKACSRLAAREPSSKVDGRSIKVAALELGRGVHARVVKSRCDADLGVAITLVEMYSRCGSIEDARRAFEKPVLREVALWNSLMLCYVDNGEAQLALEAFVFLRPENSAPNPLTFVAAIKACSSLAAAERSDARHQEHDGGGDGEVVKSESLERGMIVHSKAVGYGCDRELLVASNLLEMYSECRSPIDARIVFDKCSSWNTVLWNGLMFCCVANREAMLALELFSDLQSRGLILDALSYVSALKACATLAAEARSGGENPDEFLRRGRELHGGAANTGLLRTEIFLANSVMDMYAKCGSMEEARRVFDAMPLHNFVSWTTLLIGYSDNQQQGRALEALESMPGGRLDDLGYVAVLKACGNSAAIGVVKSLHGELARSDRIDEAPALAASLVDAYGKCGEVDCAQCLFDAMRSRDLVTWTALLSAYSRGGDGRRALELFEAMEDEGICPSSVTFVCVLAACSHAGMVERGRRYFEEMRARYGISPEVEHYVCMVDMLGRANKVAAAVEMVAAMKAAKRKTKAAVWKTVLAACTKWDKNVEVGRAAFEELLEMEEDDPAAYVLMSNIYKRNEN